MGKSGNTPYKGELTLMALLLVNCVLDFNMFLPNLLLN